ncbi:hypothetical protein SLEP1_g7071 [Rubroshorea leprosula]|uniref:Uncharacterized protein n=1 Tax=Rubroshorea leprosula TaxID=152421 RepID=A0AAV5I709_9ROSI|nr:hypothetical protein SLEP1_g7071 [Rubroshorea leprosula]
MKKMGLRKKVACFSLLLLVLLLLIEASESAARGSSARHGSFKTGNSAASHEFSPIESNGVKGFERDHKGEDGDAVFGDEKRKIHTGPNPLHNR